VYSAEHTPKRCTGNLTAAVTIELTGTQKQEPYHKTIAADFEGINANT